MDLSGERAFYWFCLAMAGLALLVTLGLALATTFGTFLFAGLAALYLACGQDVACVAESAVGVTRFEVTANDELYASVTLPNIMKAKKKPIDEKTPDAYGVDVSPRLEVLKTTEPAGRKAGVKVKTVGELVDKLKNEMGLI
jgi:hypothetical protein